MMAEIVSVSLQKDSLVEIEKLQKELELKGRSELIRLAISALLRETNENLKLKGNINALLIVTHKHHDGIVKIIHSNEELVLTHMHQHVEEKCVEIFLLKGSAEEILSLHKKLLKNKNVLGVKLVLV